MKWVVADVLKAKGKINFTLPTHMAFSDSHHHGTNLQQSIPTRPNTIYSISICCEENFYSVIIIFEAYSNTIFFDFQVLGGETFIYDLDLYSMQWYLSSEKIALFISPVAI